MNMKSKKYFLLSGLLFCLFLLFTLLVACFDVKPIGPEQSEVGFAAVNRFIFELIGVRLIWYTVTDWLGVFAVLAAACFAVAGLVQLISRRSIRNVDRRIVMMGFFYLLVIGFYVLFELVVINYRPLILGNGLEASYPSSHTMIVICIMMTAAMEFGERFSGHKVLCSCVKLIAAMTCVVTVVGRLISGVHWFSDIVGGLLLSSALVVLYYAASEYMKEG